MSAFRRLRARPRMFISAGIVTVGAVALAGAAWAYQGEPTTQVDLHDGSVWVTKQADLMIGHFNHPSALLDGGLRAGSDDYDIVQSGGHVLLHDSTASTVGVIDPATMKVQASAKLAGSSDVQVGGSAAAVLDQSSGALWVIPADAAGAFKPRSAKPQAKLGRGAAMAVGTDGTVYAVSPSKRELITVRTDAQGAAADVQRASVSGIQPNSTVTITAVGETPVILDTAHSSVVIGGTRTVKVQGTGDGAALQQPGAENGVVLLETKDALVSVGLDDGEVTSTPAGGVGTPVQPVFLKGCTYAVWDSSRQFLRDCVGEASDMHAQVEGAASGAQMRFRVNRDVVVLNDVREGGVWLAGDSMNKVDNWSDLTPPSTRTKDEESDETTIQTTLPKRTKQNHQPTAQDDEYGVRPGRTTVLPVLENDSDPDGDVLTVSLPKGGPRLGDVEPIVNGSSLQITVPKDARGSESFVYEVADGRGGKATAKVSLTVRAGGNEAPKQQRSTMVQVESGASVSYNVLPDWTDPDGDDVYLADAEPLPGDQADFTADGRVTYRSISGLTGKHDIKVTVSDGDKSTVGILRLDIRPVGSTDPVANADHVQVKAGQSLTVKPLVNDISTSADPMRLTYVADTAGAVLVPDYANGTFSFRANAIGVYYVQYQIASHGRPATSIVRVDVIPDKQAHAAPTAVRDVALLPTGGEVLVDVLANDTDPNGGVLVTQTVQVTPGSGVTAAIINHNNIRVSDTGSQGASQVQVQYTVSNGLETATGNISVIRVKPPKKLRPPVANNDTATVRVGDVVTIPVLENDYSPTGAAIHVAPDLVKPFVKEEDGEAFVSQDTVRFKAGSKPKTVHATYNVIDANGQKDAGYVTIQITPMDAKNNSAPRAVDVTSRTIAGSKQRIMIPLDGIDPDGDSVELVGLASAPTKGRIIAVGADYLDYEAFDVSAGSDTFTYSVKDRLGAIGTATVRVGIAASSQLNHAPFAIKDSTVMRPDRQVAVPVMANDSDPDGDSIALVRDGLTVPKDVPGLEAVVSGDRVVVTAPRTELTTQVQYTLRDAKGAESTGVVMIKVDKDVPLLAPVARDDYVEASQVKGTKRTVDVDVRANDDDPDGVRTDLKVTAEGGTVLPNGKVRVTIAEKSQLIRYTDTDPDGLQASAFIHVPSVNDLPPTLSRTTPVTVESGELVTIPLKDYVVAAGGKKVRITEAAKVSAVHSDGASLLKDAATLQYRSAKGYHGGDAITFEVTDGTGPDDPKGRKATLTIQLTVVPAGKDKSNIKPTFTDAQMDVAPGDDPVVIDLKPLTQDPDPGDLAKMRYSIAGGVGKGLTARLDGSRLQVSAAVDTPKGTQSTIALSITDGTSAPVRGSVIVSVTASTRPMTIAVEDDIAEAHQGTTVTVPVLENDFNPFEADGKKLKITGVSAQMGDVTPVLDGDQVKVTIGEKYFGQAIVGYTVQDATGDPDRAVDGKIVLTVQGKPDAPGLPAVDSVQSRTIVLSWAPPADNGAEITSYTVKSIAGDYQKTCEATTCTLDGLTNDVEYSFTVTATNRVGDSAPSPPSKSERPDAAPDQPQAPTLVFGDKKLDVAWVTPSTPGSAVVSYNLEISPAPLDSPATKTGVTGNSITWDGLENGRAYTVRVQAVNKAPDPSSWSAPSLPETPAGVPDAPAAPTTSDPSPVGSQAQVTASWVTPKNNGDAVSNFRVQAMQGGSVVKTVETNSGSVESANFALDTSTQGYTFQVQAYNKAGWGAWSPASAPRRAVQNPDAPSLTKADPGDGKITVAYTAGDQHGIATSEITYQYSIDGGATWRGSWTGTSNVITGLSNGSTYRVAVRAVATVDDNGYASGASNVISAVPYGPPGAPTLWATVSGTVITFHFSPPASNGRPIVTTITKINGSRVDYGPSGTRSIDVGWGGSATMYAQVVDSEGQYGPTVSVSASTPPPHMWASKGSTYYGATSGTCSPGECQHGVLNYQHLPSGSYVLRCYEDEPGYMEVIGSNNYTRSLGGDGSVELPCLYGGRSGTHLWVKVVSGPWTPSGGFSDAATW